MPGDNDESFLRYQTKAERNREMLEDIQNGRRSQNRSFDAIALAIEAVQAGAEAIKAASRVIEQLGGVPLPQTPSPPSGNQRGSVLPQWRTYPRFRADMVRRENSLPRGARSKANMANEVGGDSVRSITRRMRFFGLHDTQWPPSTWPEQAPKQHNQLTLDEVSGIAAGVVGIFLALDGALGGRLDGVVHVAKLVGCWITQLD